MDAVLGGGGNTPPPPDYTKLAKDTAASNREMAEYTTRTNRINQSNPFGSLTYNYTPDIKFDEAGYNKALAAYNAGGGGAAQTTRAPMTYDAEMGSAAYYPSADEIMTNGVGLTGGNARTAPRREDFMAPDDGGGWTQTMNLTPQAQATLDKQMKLSDQYADTASKGFANVQGLLENPNIDKSGMPSYRGIDESRIGGVRGLTSDMSGIRNLTTDNLNAIRNLNADGLQNVRQLGLDGLPQAPINAGQTAQDALFSRMNPSLARDEEALRTRLANQGISLGSSAYNREMDLQGQRANDMRLQAAAQGISLDQAARNAAFGERKDLSAFDMGLNNQQFGQRQAMTSADLAQRNQMFGENQAMSAFDLARNQQAFAQQQAQSALDLQQRQQDIGLQSVLSNSQNAQRQAMMNEAYTDQSRPLDLVSALRSGSQVQNPQFNSFAQQATTQGANMLGAAQSQYGAELGAYNAQNAQTNGLLGGIAGVGLGLAGLPGAGGSISKGFGGLFS
jgi:hypothetical protein